MATDRQRKLLALAALVAAALPLLQACSSDNRLTAPGASGGGDLPRGGGALGDAGAPGTSCATPQEGCACEQSGQTVDCGQVDRISADYVSCSMGTRTCTGGVWGACVGDRIATVSTKGTSKPQALSPMATTCVSNPCDPYCENYVDDGTNFDAGPGFAFDGGITLAVGEAGTPGDPCTGLLLSPTPQTITVTGLSPLTKTPPSLQFDAQLSPVSCNPTKITATWAVDNNDIAAIDPNGVFNVYAPVASTVQVTAYAGTWQGTGVANVLVDIHQVDQAPAGTATVFNGTSSTPDTFTILYPYANTVFPRALAAPVLQWDNGGAPADAVKISLRYPATGAPIFNWSTIVPEGTPPRATIPQQIWTAFDQTAKGNDAIFAIQRDVGGVLKNEITRKVHFSSSPLRGQIYYTEYSRGASSPLPSPAVGGSCSMPLNGAVIRSLDPTGTSAPVNPFETVAPGGCPVCHSVSANGTTFVTSNRGWGSGGGVSRINADGTFTPVSDSPQPPNPGVDSRGFAFAAVSPDGQYVLQGSNLWGNTNVNGPLGSSLRLSGGNGQGLRGDYFPNQTLGGTAALSRIDQTVNFDWGSGAPTPLVPSDQFSVRWTGQVEPYTTEMYTFQTATDDGVRLWVNGQLLVDQWADQGTATQYSGSLPLSGGVKYDIVLEYYEATGNASAKLSWSTPTTPLEIIPETQLYPTPLPPSNNGLNADYFDNIDFTAPTLSRIDKTINFDWGNGSPDPSMGVDTFSVRWTGAVMPLYTETYTFETESDDGARLWVNNQLVVDAWFDQGPTKHSGTITLAAGVQYAIKMEFYENGGGAMAKLRWSSNSTPYDIVPQSQLFPTSPAAPPPPPPPTSGLTGNYFDNIDFTAPALTEIDPTVNFDWGNGSPDPSMGVDTFSIRWTGGVLPQYSETYTFETETDDGVRVWIDNQLVIDAWVDEPATKHAGSIALVGGVKYPIKIEYFNDGAGASAKLRWSSISTPYGIVPTSQLFPDVPPTQPLPTSTSGLTGVYYDNIDFTSQMVTRIDSTVDFDWGYGSPDPLMGVDSFSIRWTGQVTAPYSETYTFETESDDGARLWVNNQLVVDAWYDQGPTKHSGTIALVAGTPYAIRMDFYENGGGAVAHLRWSSPSTPYGVIPSGQLTP